MLPKSDGFVVVVGVEVPGADVPPLAVLVLVIAVPFVAGMVDGAAAEDDCAPKIFEAFGPSDVAPLPVPNSDFEASAVVLVVGLFTFPKNELGCAEGAGAEVLGACVALAGAKTEGLPDAVEAVVLPNNEAGLAEEAGSAGLEDACCPKSDVPPVLPIRPAFSKVAGFVLGADDEESAGFVAAGNRDEAGFACD